MLLCPNVITAICDMWRGSLMYTISWAFTLASSSLRSLGRSLSATPRPIISFEIDQVSETFLPRLVKESLGIRMYNSIIKLIKGVLVSLGGKIQRFITVTISAFVIGTSPPAVIATGSPPNFARNNINYRWRKNLILKTSFCQIMVH